ncbi:MAG: Gfo/Idh/MocA family oxidoreductase, partial [Chloroflexi bacterium]|nr:Gfo/Idh/MocA family oxidoreductase [Chloroflexota bacterium]
MAAARVGLIGLGAAAREIHLPALARHPRATLVAAADPAPEGRAHAARVAGSARLYQDAEAMLMAERPDVAIVATPPHTHRDLCLLALRYGAHILCEKPLVDSLAEADEVIAAAETAGRLVAVNHQYRYLPFFREPARRLRAGAFGRLYYAQAQQQMLLTPAQEAGWRGELHRRVLFDFGIHVLDLLSLYFESDPLAVSARTPRVLTGARSDVLVVLRVDYPEERVATVVLNRVSHAPTCYLDLRLECERASIHTTLGGGAEACLGWSRERQRPTFRLSLFRGGEAWAEAGGRARRLARA